MKNATQNNAPSFDTIKRLHDLVQLNETLSRLQSLSRTKLHDLHLEPFYDSMLKAIRKNINEILDAYPEHEFETGIYGVKSAKKENQMTSIQRVASRWVNAEQAPASWKLFKDKAQNFLRDLRNLGGVFEEFEMEVPDDQRIYLSINPIKIPCEYKNCSFLVKVQFISRLDALVQKMAEKYWDNFNMTSNTSFYPLQISFLFTFKEEQSH